MMAAEQRKAGGSQPGGEGGWLGARWRALGAHGGCLSRLALVPPWGLPRYSPEPGPAQPPRGPRPLLGISLQAERPKARPLPALRSRRRRRCPLPSFPSLCTGRGTFMSTNCGPTSTLSCPLFVKLGRGPGGDPETGGWGVGTGANVCFQYAANHGPFFSV